MSKETKNFRNKQHSKDSLEMLEKHAAGDYGNAEEKETNETHNNSLINNIIEEGLEDEFINN